MQVPAFRAAGFEIAGITGRNPERTRSVARDLEVPAFDSWQELLDRSGAQWVSIVTPPSEHCELAIAALRQGFHVLCEKPTALNAREAEQMLDAARAASGQYSFIDHELRFLPTWQEAVERVRSLGALRLIEVRYASPGRGDPSRSWNWWSDATRGGGILGAVGSHMIDAVRYLAGEIEAVSAHLTTTISERPHPEGGVAPVTSDDTATVTLRLRSGVLAHLTLTVVAAVDEETTITFHGSGGGLRLRDHRLEMSERGGEWLLAEETPEIESRGNTPGGPFGTATHLLAKAIAGTMRSGRADLLEPAARFEDGLMQQRALDAARASSAKDGIWVAISDAD